MKTEDFERLKAICEKEGFDIKIQCIEGYCQDFTFVAKKKDPWEGVEFVDNGIKIRKVKNIEKGLVFYEGGSFNHLNECKPSTQEAYVEQLKKEANAKGILDVVSLDISMMDGGELMDKETEFKYRKDTDTLYWFGCPIYQKGKWAERVKERIEVKASEINDNTISFRYFGNINLTQKMPELATILEKYLNIEIE